MSKIFEEQYISLENLKELVKEYVETVLEEKPVDDDLEHYIFEAAVEMVYGRNIWEKLNKHL